MQASEFERQRERMVHDQLSERGILGDRLLEAFRKVRREEFVPEELRAHAYEDRPLPLGDDMWLAPAYTTALMFEALGAQRRDRALEIGGISGYEAALLGALAGRVTTITRLPERASLTRANLEAAGFGEVHVVVRDGTAGFERKAPYDAILVSGATPDVPEPLLEQLAPGGRLVVALGPADAEQTIYRFELRGYDLDRIEVGKARLAPLFGRHGYPTDRPIPW